MHEKEFTMKISMVQIRLVLAALTHDCIAMKSNGERKHLRAPASNEDASGSNMNSARKLSFNNIAHKTYPPLYGPGSNLYEAENSWLLQANAHAWIQNTTGWFEWVNPDEIAAGATI